MKNITITGKRKDAANMLLDILLILEDVNCSEDICINVGMDKYPSVVIEPTDKTELEKLSKEELIELIIKERGKK